MKKLKAILIGAGNRGLTYTDHMAEMKDEYEVVAVAEPIKSRREHVKNLHNIPDDMCFEDWGPLLDMDKFADVAIIATGDRAHFAPTVAAIEKKYDLLLEKPVGPTLDECVKIRDLAEDNGVKVIICTVLRYTDLFIKLKEIIDSGELGKLMSINHEECVGNVHQTHSFVRGNWGNEARSSCMLLQKSCHDMDLLQWLVGEECTRIQSFGSLSYFTKANKPEGAAEYCINGCPHADKCPYDAVKIYLDDKENDWFRTTSTREDKPTDEMVENAIRNTQYGKCVFDCDNDVVDHQVVNLEFESGLLVSFTMNAFNEGGRFIHIMGTKGELRAALDGETPITIYDFETKSKKEIVITAKDGINGGHGGGDVGLLKSMYEYLNGTYTGKSIPDIRRSVDNHLLVFAAEESRLNGTIVDFKDYVKKYQ